MKSLFLGLWLSLLTACGGLGATSNNDAGGDIKRSGGEVLKVPPQYVDRAPSLSSDGSRMVFISGRDGVNRVYVFETAAIAGEGNPRRLTTSDEWDTEESALISHDGTYAVVLAVAAGQADLFTVRLDDGQTVQLTDDAEVERGPSLSLDDKILVFRRAKAQGGWSLWAVSIGAGPSLTAKAEITGVTGSVTDAKFASGAGYSLAVMVSEPDAYGESLQTLTLDTSLSTAASTTTVVKSGIKRQTSAAFASTHNGIAFAEYLSGSGKTRSPIGGEAGETKVTVVSDPRRLTLAGTSTEIEQVGYDVVAVTASQAADFSAWATRDYYTCEGREALYGNGLYLLQGASQERLWLLTNAELDRWEISGEACTYTLADDSDAKVDTTARNLFINSSATASDFTLAFESQFYGADGYFGDPEVMVLRRVAGISTLVNASNNRNPEPLPK